MRTLTVTVLVATGGMFGTAPAVSDESSQTSAQQPQGNDRLLLTANGSSLTNTSGGAGGSMHLLHQEDPETLFGLGVEHQEIADADWTFGSVSGALNRAGRSNARWTFYGELHQGSGRKDAGSFDYSVFAAGVVYTLASGLSLQLDDRQIDIDTSRGNLPKLTLSYLWDSRLLTGVSYSHSISGNLGTDLVSVRFDYYGRSLNLLGGGAYGDAAPAVLNLPIGVAQPGRTLTEAFLGLSKRFTRAELMLVTDYQELAGTERVTVTLGWTIHLRPQNPSR